MTQKWSKIRLGDICQTNQSTYSLSEKWDYVNYLDTGNLTQDQVTEYQHIVLGVDKLPSRARRKVKPNDILYSTVRPNQLHYGIVKNLLPNTLVSTGFAVISVDEEKANSDFVYYYLTQNDVTETLQAIGEQSTSAYPSIKPSDIEKLELNLPILDEQEGIAKTLRSLDEKIEINRQINHHLAELIDAQFAHLLEDNELYKSTFSEIGEIVGGGTPSKKVDDYWNGDIPWLSPKDLSLNPAMFTGRGQNSITELGYKKSSAKLMPRNSILFSSRAPIGYITIAENDISTNQGFKSIIPKPEYPYTFVYELLKQETPSLKSSASGSTFKEVSGTHLKNHEIRIPPHSAIIKFHESVEPLFKTINLNEKEIQKLIEVRDLLLPTLMSGEISVSD
ncbi:TPA: restriction endonuclease subunit S [Streptococcus suis]